MSNRLKVLYLARWYPNRYDPMPGLFIQRHAEAASSCCNVGVVYTHQINLSDSQDSKYSIDYEVINSVPTAKIYYKPGNVKILPLNKLINIIRFYKANSIGIKHIKGKIGDFDLIHIHILSRLGIIALYYSLFFNIPFIITEHWSRYLSLTGDFKGFFRKMITRYIVSKASFVTAVTSNLANAMQSHRLLNKNYIILPNVVDDAFFSLAKKEKNHKDKTTFVHVSCFEDKSKNVSGLLRVIKELSKNRHDFVFKLIGDGMDMKWLRAYATELGLSDEYVVFTGLLEGEELVRQMSDADMLVIFSNYENFPVVINESLALGIPVVATKVGGIPEKVTDSVGVLVDAGDEKELLTSFNDFLDKKISFDKSKIKKLARDEFSKEKVGAILCELYSKSLENG